MLPALLMTLVEAVVLAGVFAYLYRSRREPFLGWWTSALAATALRHGMSVAAALSGVAVFTTLEQLAALGQALLVLAGALTLTGRRVPRRLGALAFVGAAWIVIGHTLALPFLALTLPTFVFLGLTSVASGVLVWRAERTSARWFAGAVLVVWGLHQLDYPFLRPIPSAAPWGYALAAVLEPLIAVGFLVVANERALRDERDLARRHRALLDNLPVGVFEVSLSGRVGSANPALAQMLGFDSVEALLEADLARHLAEQQDDEGRRLREAVASSSPTELQLRRVDGSPLRAVVHGTLVEDAEGRPSHFEGILRDVTERRRLQEILDRQRNMEALGRLAGGVAHDFNNLLTVVLSQVALLEPRLEASMKADLGMVEEASRRAASLCRQLLAVGRQQPMEIELVDLKALVEERRELFDAAAGEPVALRFALEETGRVKADGASLERVILDLIDNARAALPEGGALEVRAGRVEVGDEEATSYPGADSGSYAMLTVRDEGHGMEPEVRARALEPFFTTHRDRGARGLGLSSAFGVVRQLGGALWLRSAPGEGTEVRILLPQAEPA